MSSSANRRPRVAGQRRRPSTPDSTEPVTEETPAQPLRDRLRRQRRDHPTDDAGAPAADDSGASATDGAAAAPTEAAPARRALLIPALACALSLVLLATVLLITREDPRERSRAASAATATARATLEQILSYNHATMTQQLPASQALLTGGFRTEFGETMTKTIVPLAQKDKTVVKARVHEVGVASQADGTVVVQAFVNQARTSDVQKEPSIDQNRVLATMKRVDNRWLVSALRAY